MTVTQRIEIAPGSSPLDNPETAAWVDISRHVETWSIRQGRSGERATVAPGTASIEVVTEGDLDPLFTGGAYSPNVRLGSLLRISAGATIYGATVLADSPAGFWRLHESSGTAAADSSGNSRGVTFTSAPTWGVTGPLTSEPCTTATLAAGPYASRAYTAALSPTAGTVSAWVWLAPAGAGERVIAQCLTGGLGYRLCVDGSNKLTLYCNGASLHAPSAISTSTWVHVAATFSNGAQTLYMNGASVATGALAYSPSGSATFYVGSNAGANLWNGHLGEVAVFGSALTGTRVAAHYAARRPPPEFTGAIESWEMDYTTWGVSRATIEALDVGNAMLVRPYTGGLEKSIKTLKPYRYCQFGALTGGVWADIGEKRQAFRTVLGVSGETSGGPGGGPRAVCDPGGGVGGYLHMPDLFADIGSSPFTLMVCFAVGPGQDITAGGSSYLSLPNWDLIWSMDPASGKYFKVKLNIQTGYFEATIDGIGGYYGSVEPLGTGWHLLVLQRTGSSWNLTAWLDGKGMNTVLGTQTSIPGTCTLSATRPVLGGMSGAEVSLAHLALWRSELSSDQITELWRAFVAGLGDLPHERVARAARVGGLGGSVSAPAGASRMGAVAEGDISLWDYVQTAAAADEGLCHVAGDGTLTFAPRSARRRLSTPTLVLGDGAGEIPYEALPARLDTRLLATAATVAGERAEDSTAAALYGTRVNTEASSRSLADSREALARAEGIVATQAAPRLRIDGAKVRVPGNGTEAVLNWGIGTYVLVRRRPRSGQTVEQSSFIEGRTITANARSGEATIDLVLSPADPGATTTARFDVSTFGGGDTWAW